jgi:hypothetical protein
VIVDCPSKLIDPVAWQIIEGAELTGEHGIPPVAGGFLDQTASYLAAVRLVWAQERYWKRKLKID